MQFERACAVYIYLFLLFPYVSFLLSKKSWSQENFTQSLTNDAKSYGKCKRVATFALILRKRMRTNENLARRKALRRKLRKGECDLIEHELRW